ncbi:MAG: helix-turn-helix transcriptional regulator [Actinobacteria bacterium]|nr:helix-turn-helix transcriptional regulator [Actinomycetota bacterium]
MDGGHTTDPLLVLAARLEWFRNARGLTVDSLVERSSLARGQVDAALAGSENVGIFAIVKLAGALGVKPTELLDGIVWIPREGGGEFRVEEPAGN